MVQCGFPPSHSALGSRRKGESGDTEAVALGQCGSGERGPDVGVEKLPQLPQSLVPLKAVAQPRPPDGAAHPSAGCPPHLETLHRRERPEDGRQRLGCAGSTVPRARARREGLAGGCLKRLSGLCRDTRSLEHFTEGHDPPAGTSSRRLPPASLPGSSKAKRTHRSTHFPQQLLRV